MTMVQAHQQEISNNTQALSTVQNPSLKQVIVDDLPTDNMHLQGAQTQLSMLQFPTPQGHHARAIVRAVPERLWSQPHLGGALLLDHHDSCQSQVSGLDHPTG